MQPLAFLKPAMPLKAIFCCSSAEPVPVDGHNKIHNDPNRELHDSIYTSFMHFVLRRQRQATLLELALSHVEEEESARPFDEALANSALEHVTRLTTTGSVLASSAASTHSSGQQIHLSDASASPPLTTPSQAPFGTQFGAPSTAFASQASSQNASVSSMIEIPNAAQLAASISLTDPTTPVSAKSAGSGNLSIPDNSDSATSHSGSAQACSSVSPPDTPTPLFRTQSNLLAKNNQQTHTRGHITPTRDVGSAGLSGMARPFVPGSTSVFLPLGLATALSNAHSSISAQLPTLYEGVRSLSTFAGNTTTTQHNSSQQSQVSESQGNGYKTAGQNGLSLLGLLNQQTQPVLPTSSMPSAGSSSSLPNTSQHSANSGNTDHHASISSIADTLQSVHLTNVQQPSITIDGTNPMRTLEQETQHLISPTSITAPTNSQPQAFAWMQGRTFPYTLSRDNQPQTNPWIPNPTLRNAAPLDNQLQRQSDLTTPTKPSFGFNQSVSQSIRSPISVSDINRQNAYLSASISPAVITPESRGQPTFGYHDRTHSYGTPRSSSAGSWRSNAGPVSNSAFSSQRPKPRSSNSYTPVSAQPRTVASSSRQTPTLQQTPQPTVLFDMEAAKNNPLTEATSFCIHLTSRVDYGPVDSHRYFICPQNLNDDWIELTLFQWWCRGESFKMKAEKWDVKCKKHEKFFRMTLRPNLNLRDGNMPSFGPSGPCQPE